MDWRAIACIVFICTAVNHLGLIPTIERITKRKLWVIDCPKCLTCWSVMAYQLVTNCNPLTSFAIALLCSYIALWLNLFMYAIDTLYNRIYGKIEDYTEENGDEASAKG
jgi:hypothetical protein